MCLKKQINEKLRAIIKKFQQNLESGLVYELISETNEVKYKISKSCIANNKEIYEEVEMFEKYGGNLEELFTLLEKSGPEILQKEKIEKEAMKRKYAYIKHRINKFDELL